MMLNKTNIWFSLLSIIIIIISNSVVNSGKIKNVVILLADDAAFEMGAYLNRFCQTPNLDAFAKKSLIFNNAFTSVSSCSPSRAQILTGLATHQNGMYGLHHSVHHFNVFDNVKSLPNILHENQIISGIIGKKHVGLKDNFRFDYEQTEDNHSINQIGRNITRIKMYVREFLSMVKTDSKPFFLVVAFHDPHRCGHITPQYGEFCERWGSGEENMGKIPDWKPIYYDWRNLPYPHGLPETDTIRKELAAQYMTISRLDQGIGLVLKELENFDFFNSTLIMYTSDNGPPFPGGRTNLYDYGVREPMILYSPDNDVRRNSVTYAMTSLLDIFPTVMDAFNFTFNTTNSTYFTGRSLLPLLKEEPSPKQDDAIFGSQEFHEVTMSYPMRMIRTRRYKLIHNINYQLYFPIDQDSYMSPTFQEILYSTLSNKPLPWIKNLNQYYNREEWELYDLKTDSLELHNLANKKAFQDVRINLEKRLHEWLQKTNDPWICAPDGVLQNQGPFKDNPTCMTLGHKIKF